MDRLRNLLMRAAFCDPGRNLWRRLRRWVARRLLGAEGEAWRRGPAEVCLRTRSTRLIPASRELVRPRDIRLSAVLPTACFAPTAPLGQIHVAPLRVAPQELPDREPDYQMDEWLAEVTEPYILWDAPKPEYGYLEEYFLDDGEPLPELGLPPRAEPWPDLRPERNKDVRLAFSDLRRRAHLFRLPPDQLVRKRTSQTV